MNRRDKLSRASKRLTDLSDIAAKRGSRLAKDMFEEAVAIHLLVRELEGLERYRPNVCELESQVAQFKSPDGKWVRWEDIEKLLEGP